MRSNLLRRNHSGRHLNRCAAFCLAVLINFHGADFATAQSTANGGCESNRHSQIPTPDNQSSSALSSQMKDLVPTMTSIPPTNTSTAARRVISHTAARIPCDVIARQLKENCKKKIQPLTSILVEQMGNPDKGIRIEAARYLGMASMEEASDVLVKHLTHDMDPLVRTQCAASLGDIGSVRALPTLGKALNDSERDVRLAAALSMAMLGEKVQCLDVLAQALTDHDRNIRMKALSGLRNMGTESAQLFLHKALTDPDPYVQVDAAILIAEIDTSDSVMPVLRTLLKSEDMYLRLASLRGLREAARSTRNSAEAVGLIRMALTDVKNDVRERAAWTLRDLGIRADAAVIDEVSTMVTLGAYNPQAAANYADTWWNGRNPAYYDYGNVDCANFVSQCLIAGGLDLSAGPGVNSYGCIPACDNLHLNLVNSQKAQHEAKNRGVVEPTWFLKGDPAMFGDVADNWRHAVFAVIGDAQNYAQCNAHSANTSHITIPTYFSANPSFSLCNYYHIPTLSTRIISLSGNMVFGDVPVGSSLQRTLTISNTGNSTLNVSGLSYASCLSGNWSGAIAEGSSHNVTITFSPLLQSSYSGNITVNSDKTAGTSTISFSGTGTARYTLMTPVNPSGSGSVSANPTPGTDGKYAAGTVVTLTASENTGYDFAYWSGDASGSVSTKTVTMNGNLSVTANFIVEPQRYTLTTPVNPSGSGSVSANPTPGTDGKYAAGTIVTLTASENTGYDFAYWSGDASGSVNTKTVTMNGNLSVTANFIVEPQRYTLTTPVNPSGSGSVSANPTPGTDGKYAAGTIVTLTASENTGYDFAYWSGDASGSVNTKTVTMNGNLSVTANFIVEPQRYTLTTPVNPSGSGSVSANPTPDTDGKYAAGTIVTLTASENTGYDFAYWSGDASGSVNTKTVTMNGNLSVTANFIVEPQRYTLTTPVNPSGSGSVSANPTPGTDGKYAAGTIVTLTASENTGYDFAYWSGDASGSVNTKTVTMNGNLSVTANFIVEPQRYTLTTPVNPSGSGSVSANPTPGTDGKYAAGTIVTLTASENTGYDFAYWSGDASGSVNTKTVTMNGNLSVTANFIVEPQRYTLTTPVNPSGSGSVSANPTPGTDGKYAAGTVVTLTASENTGYDFAYWSGDASGSVNTKTVTMNGNLSVTANFIVESPPPVLSVTPVNQLVGSGSGSTSFTVANTGSGTMNWTAVVTSGGSWARITSGSSGVNGGTITVGYDANPVGSNARTSTVHVVASGAVNNPVDVAVVQAAGGGGELPAPMLSFEPATTLGTENTIYWTPSSFQSEGGNIAAMSSVAAMREAATTASVSQAQVRAVLPAKRNMLMGGVGDVGKPSVSAFLQSSETILTETFEGAFPNGLWTLYGSPTWDDTSYAFHNGSWSAWCANTALNPADGYTNDMNAWMIYGPFSLADAASAQANFWFKNHSESNFDFFGCMASINGTNFYGPWISGDQDTWQQGSLDFGNVDGLGNLCGQGQVWIAFYFQSDSSICGPTYKGAYVDDVVITKSTVNPVEYYAECADNSSFSSPRNSGWIQPLQCTFGNLTSGQIYWYRVKARQSGQTSVWSNVEFSMQEALSLVTVTATDATAGEPGTGQGSGMFTFTRTGPTTSGLTAGFTVGGTAGSGSDYTSLGTTVSFAVGSSTVAKTVSVIDDSVVESDETVSVTVTSGTGYAVGSPSTAMVTIKDDDSVVQPILSVTPTNQAVGSGSGSTSFAVANTGSGSMNWTSSVTSAGGWARITSGLNGVNDGTITVGYDANPVGGAARTATLQVAALGASGSPQYVTVSQARPSDDVTVTATRVLPAYQSPGTMDVTVTFTKQGTNALTSLAFSETLPSGWTFNSLASADIPIKPSPGAGGTLEFAWISVPALPVTVTYRVNVPAGETSAKTFSGNVRWRTSGGEQSVATGGDTVSNPTQYHSADTGRNWRIEISPELTRIIQFYNAGEYHCQTGTEDSYAPGPGSHGSAAHHSDYSPQDWRIQLSPELTRLIQFYNVGGYHVQPGTEDGFAPGSPSGLVAGLKRVELASNDAQLAAAASTTLSGTRAFSAATYVSSGTLDVTVRVTKVGTDAVNSLAVFETLPAQWSFNAIVSLESLPIQPSIGQTGTISFAWLATPAFPHDLIYRVNVPNGSTGIKVFTGDVRYRLDAGEITVVTPATSINDQMPQPILSVNPTNQPVGSASGSTSFTVANAGSGTMTWAASVTSGGSWGRITSGSNGVNGGAVTVGYDANTGEGLRQVTVRVTASGASGSPADVTVTQEGSVSQQNSAVRSIGGASVSITVTPAVGTSAYAVEESVPAGLTVSGINENGVWDNVNRKVKWGPWFDANTRTLTYTVSGPNGDYTVSGMASFDGAGQSITGPSTIHMGDDPNRDSDGDGMSDWAELIAGTDSADSNSCFKIGFPVSGVYAPSGNGVVVQWFSASNRVYHLNRSTNLNSEFNLLDPIDIPATPAVNVYTDTTATGIGPYYYKVGVEKRGSPAD